MYLSNNKYFNQEFAIWNVRYKLLLLSSSEADRQSHGHSLVGGRSLRAITVQRDCSSLSPLLRRYRAKEELFICWVLVPLYNTLITHLSCLYLLLFFSVFLEELKFPLFVIKLLHSKQLTATL